MTETPATSLAGVSLASLLRQLPVGLVVAEHPGGRVVHGSELLQTIWRRSVDPPLDVADYSRWKGWHADGRPYSADEWPLARALEAGEVVKNEEIEISRGDGSRGIVLVAAAPILDPQGRRIGASST
ncbi:MAG: hypothetical protein H0U67_08575, partial [Gemmatimonadetes bacterium]|nr:hypothetical protein [Gemmatimonadota bacterium]